MADIEEMRVEIMTTDAHERIATALERIADALEAKNAAEAQPNPPHVFGGVCVNPQHIKNY